MVNAAVAKLERFASPSAARNAVPIADALAPVLPGAGLVLEVASGNGYHAAILAACFPDLSWQPSDPDPELRMMAAEVRETAQLSNLLPPLDLNAGESPWPISHADAILCCNMIHIAPWPAAAGLMRGASQILSSGSALILYGPFAVEGVHTAPSNAQFDHSLRARNPAWGVRDTVDVDQIAQSQGLEFECHIPMPANNMIRVYRRTTA